MIKKESRIWVVFPCWSIRY